MKPIKLNSHSIGRGIFCMIFILKEKDEKTGRGAVQMHPLNGVTGGVTLLAGA